eukprot:jgi/Psemu1/241958/estExt_Genewise1.C_2540014
MSKELLKLSLNDRNAILEETHGVRCLAPCETPDMIRSALDELQTEIDKTPMHKKCAYLRSQHSQEYILPDGTKATPTFVNSDDFRLRFLRASLFDTQQAAELMLKYLEVALEFFGTCALFRPVELRDFTKEELTKYKRGNGQNLPFRDRFGRRVMIIIADEKLEGMTQELRMKLLLYATYNAGTGDVDLQRKGIVAILWSQSDVKFQFRVTPEKSSVQLNEFAPLRISAMHICTPDTLFYNFARGMWAIGFGRRAFSRIRFHIGTAVELRYALESYGISMNQLPITYSGTIKLQYFKQWLRQRQILEKSFSSTNGNSRDSGECNSNHPPIVECPRLNDVIFRKGTRVMCHPGNVFFRSKIHKLYNETEAHTTARTSKALTTKLIEDIRSNNGRVLIWHQSKKGPRSNDCWYTELRDEEQVFAKIQSLVRELKFSSTKYQTINHATSNQTVSGASSLFVTSSQDGCFANSRGRKRRLDAGEDNGDHCYCT